MCGLTIQSTLDGLSLSQEKLLSVQSITADNNLLH